MPRGGNRPKCSVDGCERLNRIKGLCQLHAERLDRNGHTGLRKKKHELQLEWFENAIKEQTDNCILWPFRIWPNGYGDLRGPHSVSRLVHRVSCQQAHGAPQSDGMVAAHSCRNRNCINPRHLRWATYAENTGDMVKDGTAIFGERNGNAKLTESEVISIRLSSLPDCEIAKKYNISPRYVRRLKSGDRWSHCGPNRIHFKAGEGAF